MPFGLPLSGSGLVSSNGTPANLARLDAIPGGKVENSDKGPLPPAGGLDVSLPDPFDGGGVPLGPAPLFAADPAVRSCGLVRTGFVGRSLGGCVGPGLRRPVGVASLAGGGGGRGVGPVAEPLPACGRLGAAGGSVVRVGLAAVRGDCGGKGAWPGLVVPFEAPFPFRPSLRSGKVGGWLVGLAVGGGPPLDRGVSPRAVLPRRRDRNGPLPVAVGGPPSAGLGRPLVSPATALSRRSDDGRSVLSLPLRSVRFFADPLVAPVDFSGGFGLPPKYLRPCNLRSVLRIVRTRSSAARAVIGSP